MYQQTPPLPELVGPVNTLQRHGCLTAWLIFIMVVNGILAVATPFLGGIANSGLSAFDIGFIMVGSLLNIVWAVALFKWFRWGFYGFVATTVVGIVVNLATGTPIAQSTSGLLGVSILYWMLQLGTPKAWERLK
ncbi:MAG: hypothetical protein H8F28_10235 [Fibrella sp.]|nr:hypothetical protein [Armatimonadota bacterium]